MHSVLENDSEKIKEGKVLNEALNNNVGNFTPDLMMKNAVNNYELSKQIYGKLLQLISGYDDDYIERNIKIPEFAKQLKEKLKDYAEKIKDEGLLKKDLSISDKGVELASLVLYIDELASLKAKGFEGKSLKEKAHYGDYFDSRSFKPGDRYKDIALKRSVKKAARRLHTELVKEDLEVKERRSKGYNNVVFALDASSSMRQEKINACKKAGIALGYKAIDEKDKVGLVVFGSEVRKEIKPTSDFTKLVKEITAIRASERTDFVKMIEHASDLFDEEEHNKHLIILTDALPTVGVEPEKETLEAVSIAREKGITVSIAGINLDKKGSELASKIAEIGEGKFYIVNNLEELDKIVLEDYYGVS